MTGQPLVDQIDHTPQDEISGLSSSIKAKPSTAAEYIFNSIQRSRTSKSNSELSYNHHQPLPLLEAVSTTVEKESTAATPNVKNMIPPIPTTKSSSTGELIETRPSLKRERADTSGSNKSALLSMDLGFLRSEDVELDGGLAGLGSERSLQSSDIVRELILPSSNSAETARVCNISNEFIPLKSEDCSDKLCPLVELASQLERITTGDEVIPLNKDIRISSSDWVKDFKAETESGVGAMSPSMFEVPPPFTTSMPPVTTSIPLDTTSMPPVTTSMPSMSKPTSSIALPSSYEEVNVPLRKSSSSNTSKNETKSSPPASTTTQKRRRKKKKRLIDESRIFEPTDNDVLFGRGGFTNTHPGNLKFRQKALELRPWYESVTKEEKYSISDLLVEYVKATGNHFLEKGSDGLWHEVVGNGARKKASQALRERVRGKRSSANKDNGIDSSIKSNGSAALNVADTAVEELIGDIQPTRVVGI